MSSELPAEISQYIKRALEEDIGERDAMSSPQTVREFLRLTLGGKAHEIFMAMFLDAQNRLLGSEELFRGTLTQTSVYPREVVKTALRYNAAGVIFAHNHPSGVAEPSRADELLTQTLKQALSLVEIKTLDHFIVAGFTPYSCWQSNYIHGDGDRHARGSRRNGDLYGFHLQWHHAGDDDFGQQCSHRR